MFFRTVFLDLVLLLTSVGSIFLRIYALISPCFVVQMCGHFNPVQTCVASFVPCFVAVICSHLFLFLFANLSLSQLSTFNEDVSSSAVFRIRTGFNADPDPTFTSMRIRTKGAKPVWIHADPDPDPGQTLPSRKVGF
jgi:hypothetical protein